MTKLALGSRRAGARPKRYDLSECAAVRWRARVLLVSPRGVLADDYAPDVVQFLGRKAVIPRKVHRRDPELGLLSFTTDVKVRWLDTVETVEEVRAC